MIVGLDLSLSAAGMVAVPENWGGDWSKLHRQHVGHRLPSDVSEARRIGRLHQITIEIVKFVQRHRASTVILEEYAFASATSHAHALGEIGGATKLALATQAGCIVDTVHSATARKLLLGKLPRKDVKVHVRVALDQMGMPKTWTDDEADAFVVANWKALQLGAYALVVEQAA